jgi:hypothetical protein
MTIPEFSSVFLGSALLGAGAKEGAKVIVDRFFRKNGSDKTLQTEKAMREAVFDVHQSTVLPALNAQSKSLDQLVSLNQDMRDGILKLCVLAEIGK